MLASRTEEWAKKSVSSGTETPVIVFLVAIVTCSPLLQFQRKVHLRPLRLFLHTVEKPVEHVQEDQPVHQAVHRENGGPVGRRRPGG